MNIDEVLDMLDELLDRAWNLPLSGGRCVIDAEKVREMVDDIRLNLPDEIKQAKPSSRIAARSSPRLRQRRRPLSARQRSAPG